jgi:hypothetical protein
VRRPWISGGVSESGPSVPAARRKRRRRAEGLRESGLIGGSGETAQAVPPRWTRTPTPVQHGCPAQPASPAGCVTGSRQEVSELIGLGQSSRREQSLRGVLTGESPKPLARETSAGAALNVRTGRKARLDDVGRRHLINGVGELWLHWLARNREATPGGADRGSDDPAVVLADGLVAEVDERRLAYAQKRWSSLVRTRVHRRARTGRTGAGSRIAAAKP